MNARLFVTTLVFLCAPGVVACHAAHPAGAALGSDPAMERSPVARSSASTAEVADENAAPPVATKSYAPLPDATLRARLTPLEYEVTQNAATEPPFQNAYFDNHRPGIYVDVATGEPLFSSRDKFESGTGWPSFTRPIEAGRVVRHEDLSHGMVRTEVLSAGGSSHLGHVFDDGPAPTGLRYCINSAALRFVPAEDLAKEGYGKYAAGFAGEQASSSPPPSTSNSCAVPPPGATPGCSATLDVAIFARAAGDDEAARPLGVLDVAQGREGTTPAVKLSFDPSKIGYADLVAAWTKGRERGATVFARGDVQKAAAKAKAFRVVDAVPFTDDAASATE